MSKRRKNTNRFIGRCSTTNKKVIFCLTYKPAVVSNDYFFSDLSECNFFFSSYIYSCSFPVLTSLTAIKHENFLRNIYYYKKRIHTEREKKKKVFFSWRSLINYYGYAQVRDISVWIYRYQTRKQDPWRDSIFSRAILLFYLFLLSCSRSNRSSRLIIHFACIDRIIISSIPDILIIIILHIHVIQRNPLYLDKILKLLIVFFHLRTSVKFVYINLFLTTYE